MYFSYSLIFLLQNYFLVSYLRVCKIPQIVEYYNLTNKKHPNCPVTIWELNLCLVLPKGCFSTSAMHWIPNLTRRQSGYFLLIAIFRFFLWCLFYIFLIVKKNGFGRPPSYQIRILIFLHAYIYQYFGKFSPSF